MAGLVWVMVGLALWHFTVFLPDRFWGGIVGALIAGVIGAALFGYLVSGLSIPGRSDTTLIQAFIAVPGTLLGLAASYAWGTRLEQRG